MWLSVNSSQTIEATESLAQNMRKTQVQNLYLSNHVSGKSEQLQREPVEEK